MLWHFGEWKWHVAAELALRRWLWRTRSQAEEDGRHREARVGQTKKKPSLEDFNTFEARILKPTVQQSYGLHTFSFIVEPIEA